MLQFNRFRAGIICFEVILSLHAAEIPPPAPVHCTSFVLTAVYDICNVDTTRIYEIDCERLINQSIWYSQHVAQKGDRGNGQADAYCHCQR